MSRVRMGPPAPGPPPLVTAAKKHVTRQGCPSAGAPQGHPSLDTSRARNIAHKPLQGPHYSFSWGECMCIIKLLASGNHLEMETGGNHDARAGAPVGRTQALPGLG